MARSGGGARLSPVRRHTSRREVSVSSVGVTDRPTDPVTASRPRRVHTLPARRALCTRPGACTDGRAARQGRPGSPGLRCRGQDGVAVVSGGWRWVITAGVGEGWDGAGRAREEKRGMGSNVRVLLGQGRIYWRACSEVGVLFTVMCLCMAMNATDMAALM